MITTLALFKRCCESVLIAKELPDRPCEGARIPGSLAVCEHAVTEGFWESTSATNSCTSGFLLTPLLSTLLLLQDHVHSYLALITTGDQAVSCTVCSPDQRACLPPQAETFIHGLLMLIHNSRAENTVTLNGSVFTSSSAHTRVFVAIHHLHSLLFIKESRAWFSDNCHALAWRWMNMFLKCLFPV